MRQKRSCVIRAAARESRTLVDNDDEMDGTDEEDGMGAMRALYETDGDLFDAEADADETVDADFDADADADDEVPPAKVANRRGRRPASSKKPKSAAKKKTKVKEAGYKEFFITFSLLGTSLCWK
ncbi:hypothetical protein CYMTET_43644 [Cymbomonas tetramitiformis]|uniref:Uncharacterized protein n=1 Tax=Cymbomonas tetramitiformis TaxID=36881 RepID=A0AAE0F033_9CHLO|nr:hypothetical protein CYMTET_43644 [Cymbomonas tetramitiformis]